MIFKAGFRSTGC